MSRIFARRCGLAATMAVLVIGAAGAQTPAPPGPEIGAAPNPHAILGDLTGGPAGSPTAERGNPRPGTSTSIPTTNPAPVIPLPERTGGVAEENTGIAGQCDPNVGLGNCPEGAGGEMEQAGAGKTSVEVFDYRCAGEQTLQVAYVNGADGTNFALLLRDDRMQVLPQSISASGAIYGQEGTLQWLTKGNEAFLEGKDSEDVLKDCRR